MLSAATLDAYSGNVVALGQAAESYVAGVLDEARARGAGVEEMRDLAIEAILAAADEFGGMSRELACELYEGQTGASATFGGAGAERAQVEKSVRYLAGTMMDGSEGGAERFVRACATKAAYHARQGANKAVMGSCARASRAGGRGRASRGASTRFARVPRGGDTCTFCAMLASRGFVYWSRKTAGEFDHYHDHCRCLVVPDDGSGKVEGYDPDEWADKWGEFKEIDRDETLTTGQKEDAKSLISVGRAATMTDVKRVWYEEGEQFAANLKAAQSSGYLEALKGILGDDAGLADRVWKDARHTLKMRNGTSGEDLYAYDLDTGKRIARQTGGKARLSATVSDGTRAALRAAAKAGHRTAIMHNHPGSSGPSAADFATLAKTKSEYGLIACHDGSIIKFTSSATLADLDKASAKALDAYLERRYADAYEYGKSEAQAFVAIGNDLGVRIERVQVSHR